MSSSTRSSRRLCLAAFVALLLLAVPASANAATRHVRTSGLDVGNCTNPVPGCRTIGYAVGQANGSIGDIVDVGPGTFTENQIVVTNPMTIRGQGAGNTIVNSTSGPVPGLGGLFLVNPGSSPGDAGDVTIDGFTLQGGIKDNQVNPEPFLIQAYQLPAGGTLTVSNNDLETSTALDADLGKDYSIGVYVYGSGADVRVLDNTLNGFFQAVFLEQDTGRATIAGNDFDGLLGSDCPDPPGPCNGSGFQFPLGVFVLNYDGVSSTELKSIENNRFRNFNGASVALNVGFALTMPATLSNVDIIGNHVATGGAVDESTPPRNPSAVRIVGNTNGTVDDVNVLGNDLWLTSLPVAPVIFVRNFGTPAGNVNNVSAHFNRFKSAGTIGVQRDGASTVDASNNWWGCNGGPGTSGCLTKVGAVNSSPHLVLNGSASPTSVFQHESSTVEANVARDSNGATPPGNVFPAGVPVNFATTLGTVTPATAFTASPFASALFKSATAGTASVSATLDSQTVTMPVTVNAQPAGPSTPAAAAELPAAPTIAFVTPDENGTLGLGAQTTVTLSATAAAGLGTVNLAFNGRSVCTLTATPFTCQFQPRSTDGGREGTFTATVTDRDGRAASASRNVSVGGPAELGSHTGRVRSGVGRVRIKCARFGPCNGTVDLKARIGGRRSPLVGVESTGFDLRAGQTKTIEVDLSASARRILRQKGFLGTRATVTTGDTAITRNLVLHSKR